MNSTNSNVTVVPAYIIQEIYEGIVYDWVSLSCTVLLFYAALLKLPQEIQYIWTKPFSVITWLYVFARYGSLVQQGLLLSIIFATSESSCNILANASQAASFLSYAGIQGLLIIRAYTLCPSKILAAGLAFGFFSSVILELYAVIAFPGCFTGSSDIDVEISLSSDIATILSELIVFCICMRGLWSTWKLKNEAGIRNKHSIVSVLVKQSILRCCFVVVINTADSVLIGAENTSDFIMNFSRVYNTLQNGLSSILVADFTLDLRGLNATKIEASKASFPPLRFTNFLQYVHQTITVELATPENNSVEDSLDDYDPDITGFNIESNQTA